MQPRLSGIAPLANVDPTSAALFAPFGIRLSVAMIVRDEAANLAQALASVAAIADELIVVDTGSTDGTVAIATQAGATFVHHPWADDFAAARNVALAHCTGDWVLCLDADEWLAPESAHALRQRLTPPTEPLLGYRVRIVNWQDGQRIEAIEYLAPRLFPHHPAIRFVGRIRELAEADPASGATLTWEAAPAIVLHHDGYRRDEAGYAAKQARNLALLAQAVESEPEAPYWHFHYGVALQNAERYEAAIEQYRAAIAHCQDGTAEVLPYGHIYLMSALIAVDKPAEATAWGACCQSVCEWEPDYWLNLGIAAEASGNHDGAIAAYQRCLALADRPQPALISDRGATSWKPLIGLASAYLALGDHGQAETYLRQAVNANPRHVEAVQSLIRLSLERQDTLQAEVDMRHLWQICSGDDRLHVYRELCLFLISVRRLNAAAEYYTLLAAEPESPKQRDLLIELASVLDAAGATPAVLAALAPYRLTPGIYQVLARLHGVHEAYDALIALCDALLDAGIDEPFARYYKGLAHLFNGDPAGAVGDLRRAAELRPDELDIWNHLGSAHMALGEHTDAEACFQKTLDQDPGDVSAHIGMIHLVLKRADMAEALTQLKAVLAMADAVDLAEATGAILGLKDHCESLFSHPRVWSGAYDTMSLSHMIDLLTACARRLRERPLTTVS